MSAGHQRLSFAELLRRLVAAGGVALVLMLTVLAACPQLHHALHDDHGIGADDHCAVTLFASGVSAPAAAVTVLPPSEATGAASHWTPPTVFVVSPRYLRQPERGPPALS